jgi:hypothetical protein
MTMIGIITGVRSIASGARVQTVLETRRQVLLIAGVDGIRPTPIEKEEPQKSFSKLGGAMTAIQIEKKVW